MPAALRVWRRQQFRMQRCGNGAAGLVAEHDNQGNVEMPHRIFQRCSGGGGAHGACIADHEQITTACMRSLVLCGCREWPLRKRSWPSSSQRNTAAGRFSGAASAMPTPHQQATSISPRSDRRRWIQQFVLDRLRSGSAACAVPALTIRVAGQSREGVSRNLSDCSERVC